ncbi:hypothetical protein GCM10023350_16980 [Nocardioides endophyticus]|uniref:MftR C-terminal domain-containing protein n=2 Tax=Nocardioides endophyticus TaxID=1353775 RepID=A0ABP8YN75_9ACTN
MAMIAAESGLSRSSVFRYWGSKSEIIWAEFDAHTAHLRELLDAADPTPPTMTVIRSAVVANLSRSIDASAMWLERFMILDRTPELRVEESARWLAWASEVAEYVARRHGLPVDGVTAQSIGSAVQAAFLATLRQWAKSAEPPRDGVAQADAALAPLCAALQGWLDQV